MAVDINVNSSGVLPFQTVTDGTTQGQQANNTQNLQSNQYTAQQQAMQSQGLSGLAGIMAGGSVPSNFGLPQSVYDAAFANFNQYQAPLLAAQNGAGSPAINSAMQNLQLQLAGLAGSNAMSNFNSIYSAGLNYAFQPIGQASAQNTTGTFNQVDNQTQTGFDYGNFLGGIGGAALMSQTFP